ncbi:MAG: putative toxin-antitoxin system toxin component, PIN family [Dehalococcoidales bacterium]|nr:putative toxin-antitoxin system toxin component, PIN family [Dehalococcoidales bacterium]
MPKSKHRVFLDSNVIFSGLYSPEGAPGIILEHFLKGNIRVVVSQQVLEEVIRTINEKLPYSLPTLRRLLINTPPEVAADPQLPEIKFWTKILHLGDAAILAAAIAAHPNYFITGDRHFTENSDIIKKTGLTIVTPAQFLKVMQ